MCQQQSESHLLVSTYKVIPMTQLKLYSQTNEEKIYTFALRHICDDDADCGEGGCEQQADDGGEAL